MDWIFQARYESIRDGDTPILTLDLGFRLSMSAPIRLLGIDCPERYTTEGVVASIYATEWLVKDGVVDWPLFVTLTKGARLGSFDRYLGEVSRRSDGRQLIVDLLANGHAIRWSAKRREQELVLGFP